MRNNAPKSPKIIKFKNKLLKKKNYSANNTQILIGTFYSICLLIVESYRPVEFLEKNIFESWWKEGRGVSFTPLTKLISLVDYSKKFPDFDTILLKK